MHSLRDDACMHEQPLTRPAILLRRHQWDRHMDAKELVTDSARADSIGVNRTTVGRIQSGEALPGETFVAAVLLAHQDLRFEDVFEVAMVPDRESA